MVSFFGRLRHRSTEQRSNSTHAGTTSATEATDVPSAKDTEKIDPTVHDSEKPNEHVASSGTTRLSEDEVEDLEDLPEDVRQLPRIVRNIVSLEDDPNAPTLTFRYFLLCFIFVPPGAVLFQMGIYRTTAAVYPVLFVQIGKSLDRAISPHRTTCVNMI
jgi:hypothetical protein